MKGRRDGSSERSRDVIRRTDGGSNFDDISAVVERLQTTAVYRYGAASDPAQTTVDVLFLMWLGAMWKIVKTGAGP